MEQILPILTLDIANEMDVMLAHRRGMQFAKFSGTSLSEQTRFGTAVSEICRNSLEYAGHGNISFSIVKKGKRLYLEAIVQDKGKGIANLSEILQRKPEQVRGRGIGIAYAQKLLDGFKIVSKSTGTTVTLQKNIPVSSNLINKLVIQGWITHLQKEPVISAYEELKIRNMQLLELTEELRNNGNLVQQQIAEIRKLNDKLSGSNEQMKEFTYAISHDLKTPLSSLKLATEMLNETPEGPNAMTYRNIITRSTDRLDKTIHSLIEILDFQNNARQTIKEVNLADVFQEVMVEHEQTIVESKAVIETNFSSAPSIAYIEVYLQSLMHNLLSNALKYRQLDKDLKISVESKQTKSGIQLNFADSGLGMDLPSIRPRLFQPFNRFSQQTEGKGIGLYLIKGMVENNGGSVHVESTPGVGTVFTFQLISYAH